VTVSFGGGNVVHRTVRFTGDSVTGLEALRGAGFSVEAYGYSGIGAAVCRIDGVGRPADAACLNGGSTYWAYFRNGTYSRIGAGASRVVDGDQEQWAWGSGASAPPTTSFAAPTTTTSTAPVAPQPSTSTPPTAVRGSTTAPTGPGGPRATASSAPTTRPATSSIRPEEVGAGRSGGEGGGPAAGSDETAAGKVVGRDRPDAGDGGGGPLAMAGFGAVLAAVVGLTLKARSARGTGPSPN
jgi:hypothetical protein